MNEKTEPLENEHHRHDLRPYFESIFNAAGAKNMNHAKGF